jgi:hypothetical protein
MNNISVFENFLTNDELNIAINIIDTNEWKYGHYSVLNAPGITPFFKMDLNNNEFFSTYLKYEIEKQLSKKFKLITVYAVGQSFGQNGDYHIDSELDNHYTFCLYLTQIQGDLIDLAEGYIHFKIPNKKYIVSYQPIANRGIFFPSNYLHKGCAFSRYVNKMRICIAWKLEEIIHKDITIN